MGAVPEEAEEAGGDKEEVGAARRWHERGGGRGRGRRGDVEASGRRGGDEDDGAASRRRGSGVGRGEGKGIEGEGEGEIGDRFVPGRKYGWGRHNTNGAPPLGAP